jgi:hypothetical protein
VCTLLIKVGHLCPAFSFRELIERIERALVQAFDDAVFEVETGLSSWTVGAGIYTFTRESIDGKQSHKS